MTPLTAGFKLWWRAIILNAVAMGLLCIPWEGAFAIPMLLAAFVFGLVIGSPMIIVFSWLIKVYTGRPYHAEDKFVWLLFMLALAIIAFCLLLLSFFSLYESGITVPGIFSSLLAVMVSAFRSKSAIKQLNTYNYEQHLV